MDRRGTAASTREAASNGPDGVFLTRDSGWLGRPAVGTGLTLLGLFLVVAILVWQGITAYGNPDPVTTKGLSPFAMAMDSGVLVLREGLEAILVLAAITAGVVRNRHSYWRAIFAGVGVGLIATVATWFIVVAIISQVNASEYAIQAATGLLAIVVLLVVMNWFFHKIYWTGWIAHHNNRKRKLLQAKDVTEASTFLGLAFLGFTAIYREGFEIVLFLQNLRLKAGSGVVFSGVSIGLALTLIVAALTFAAHQRLPYKKMLVFTGILLGVVLIVMIGESAQEMQQANWIPTTALHLPISDWMGTWFAIFPNVECLAAQALAVLLVAGSYAWIRLKVRLQTK